MTVRIVMTVLAYVLFAAHLSRHDLDPLAIVALLMPLLLFIKRRWVIVLLETVLYIATVSWIIPAVGVVKERIAEGVPYLRYVLIIGAVTVYTFITALMLRSPKIRDRYA